MRVGAGLSGLDRPGVGVRGGALVGLVVLALLSLASTAYASHYRLGESGLVTSDELAALAKAEVRTTKDVVDRAGPKKARRMLARATRIAETRLWELAQTCDLLRVRGLGMSMAKLIRAAGVDDAAALGKQNAGALAERLKTTNATKRIAEITPDARQLTSWIAQAKGLPKVLERK